MNLRRSAAAIRSKSGGFLQRLGRGRRSSAANARLRDRLRHNHVAKAGYWIVTPYKVPARIGLLRQLTLNNEQLVALNTASVAKMEALGNANAELISRTEQLHTQNGELGARIDLLNKQNAELSTRIDLLNKQNGELGSRVDQLNKQNGELGSRVDQLNKQNGELGSRIEHLIKQSALDRPLAFMQTPKTSGSALTIGLCDVLPGTARIHGWDHGFFGGFRDFEAMSPKLQQEIYQSLPSASGADFVYGQFAYSTLVQGRPTARVMTVLREPRTRLLSLWLYWRSFSDDDHAAAGAWGSVQRLTRRSLAEFLNRSEAACQTDNVYVRRLLWPHPLIPDDGFIDSASDEHLVNEAVERLKAIDFADVVEDPQLEDNVRAFVARPFVYRRMNETDVRPDLGVRLEEELSGETLLLLEHRSRLGRKLWQAVAAERIAGVDPTALGDDTFRRAITRYAALMSAD